MAHFHILLTHASNSICTTNATNYEKLNTVQVFCVNIIEKNANIRLCDIQDHNLDEVVMTSSNSIRHINYLANHKHATIRDRCDDSRLHQMLHYTWGTCADASRSAF